MRQGYDRHVTYRANSLLALRDAAAQGLGLALLPSYLGDRVPVPVLARVGTPVAELRNELWLLTPPDLRRMARIRAFMDAMRAAVQPLQPLGGVRVTASLGPEGSRP